MPRAERKPRAERRPRGRHVRGPWRPSSFGGVLGTVLLNAVLPGSAQLSAGRKVVGRLALTCWLLLLLCGLGVIGYVLVTGDVGQIGRLTARPDTLRGIQLAALVIGVLWLLLVLDGWRITRPLAWPAGQRLVSGLMTGVVAVVGVVPLYYTAQYANVSRGVITDVLPEQADEKSFTAQQRKQRPDGRINILLLGGDGADDRKGVRTDSMQVVSVDRRTGKAVLIALPRSLQNAPFPDGSPMDERFPNGFDDLLTNLYPYGHDHPDLFPDASNPGAEAIMQAAGEITGLPIDLYALVNLDGFRDVIDAIGGIDMYVTEKVPIGGERYPDGSVKVEPHDWIEPGQHHLDGYHALWYARGRFTSDDYSRMRRQRCVMGAILDQANPTDILLRFKAIANSAKNLLETNISQGRLPELVDIAADTRGQKIVSITLTRELIDTVDPDFEATQDLVREALRESKNPGTSAIPDATPTPTPGAGATKGTDGDITAGGGAAGGSGDAAPENENDQDEQDEQDDTISTPSATATPEPQDATTDLESVCRYS